MAEKTRARRIGDIGEDAAAALLEKKGYAILDRNYRIPGGEIDIIAEKDEYIVFAEVKTRELSALDRPSSWVGKSKQRKLILTASVYLEEKGVMLQPRFDVVEVVYDKRTGMTVHTEHIENAFMQEDDYAAF